MRRLDGFCGRVVSAFVLFCLSSSLHVRAEIPLPDSIVYGTIELGGGLVGDGEIVAVVDRSGRGDEPMGKLEVAGVFREFNGVRYYVIRIPMETTGVTPLGSSPLAARNGDVLESIKLDGEMIIEGGEALESAAVSNRSAGNPAGDPEFIRGDSNADGKYDASDAVFTLHHLFLGGSAPSCLSAADANDDGALDIADPVGSLFQLFKGSPIPGPYPNCGPDPTDDDISCLFFPSCGLGNEGAVARLEKDGRGERPRGGAFFGASEPPPLQAPPIPRLVARFGSVSDSDDAKLLEYGVWAEGLDVSPPALRIGHLPAGKAHKRTVSLGNRDRAVLDLTLTSTVETVEIFPKHARIAAGDSYVVFVSIHDDSTAAPGIDHAKPAIEIRSGEELLARLPVEWTHGDVAARVEIGQVRNAAGSRESLVLPIRLGSEVPIDEVELALEFDSEVFSRAEFFSSGLYRRLSMEEPREGRLALRAEGATASDGVGLLGHVALYPADPSWTGTTEVALDAASVRKISGETNGAATTHGEVCTQVAWLDLDRDGEVLPSFDVIVARRVLTGHTAVFPSSWDTREREPLELVRNLSRAANYLDVDASGEVDSEDLDLVVAELCGFSSDDPDVAGRVANLSVPLRNDKLRPSVLRTSARAHARTVEGRTVVVMPLRLDLTEPLKSLETEITVPSGSIRNVRIEASERTRSSLLKLERTGPGAVVRFDPGEGREFGVLDGTGPLAVLSFEIDALEPADRVKVALSTSRAEILGSTATVALREARDSPLHLHFCPSRTFRRILGTLIADSPWSPGLVLLDMEISDPGFAFEELSLLDGVRDGVKSFQQIGPRGHELRALLFHPEGESLLRSESDERVLQLSLQARGARDEQHEQVEAAGDLLIAVEIRESFAGPRRSMEGPRVETIASLVPCGDAEEHSDPCRDAVLELDLGKLRELLSYLYSRGPRPECIDALDRNGDGQMALDDVVGWTRELIAR